MEVTINFTIPELDPIGEHRLMYRWMFYSNINAVTNTWIQGNPDPFFYGTYVSIGDFFNTDSFLNIFYIMLALSMFLYFGWPFMWAFGFYMNTAYIFEALTASAEFSQWPGAD